MKKIIEFLKSKDDIEMFMITCVLGTIFAFFIYCGWSLIN
jgi:hypothetical protein